MKKMFLFLMLLCFTAGAVNAQCVPNVRISNTTSCTVYYVIGGAAGCFSAPSDASVVYALPPGVTHSRAITTTTFPGGPLPPGSAFYRIIILGNPSGTCGSTGVDPFSTPTGSFVNTCCPGPAVIADWIPGGPSFAHISIHN